MPLGEGDGEVLVVEAVLGGFVLAVLIADVELEGLIEGTLWPMGSTEGRGASGTPEGRLIGVHTIPPGPIKTVTGLL